MDLLAIFSDLTQRTTTGTGVDYSGVGKMDADELLKLRRDLHSALDSNMNALRISGDLISAYDQSRGNFDCNAVGWMVTHLADTRDSLSDLLWSVEHRLNRLGYDNGGKPIKGADA